MWVLILLLVFVALGVWMGVAAGWRFAVKRLGGMVLIIVVRGPDVP